MAQRSRALTSNSDSDDEPLADRLPCRPGTSGQLEAQPRKPTKEERKKIKRKKRKEEHPELQHGQQIQQLQLESSNNKEQQQGQNQQANLEQQTVAPSSKKHKAKHRKSCAQPDDAAAQEPNGHLSQEPYSKPSTDLQAQVSVETKKKSKKRRQKQEEQPQPNTPHPQQQDAAVDGKHLAVFQREQRQEATAVAFTDANDTKPKQCKKHKKGNKAGADEHVPHGHDKYVKQSPTAPVADHKSDHQEARSKSNKAAATDKQPTKCTKAARGHGKGAGQQHTQQAAASDTASDLWYKRCRRIILNCLESDCYEIVARSLVTWDAAEVMALVKGWAPHIFAAVFASYPADKLAELLQCSTAEDVAAACESWPVEQLVDVLPLLRTKTVRQVLRLLYFNSADPYLTIVDAKHILMAMPDNKREKVCKKLKRKLVNKVLNADEKAADSLNEDDDYGSDDDDSYDSSFVVSDEDDIEEGEEVDAYAELEDSDC